MNMNIEIILSIVTLLTFANVVNAQDTATDIAKNRCILSKLSNLAIIDAQCESFDLAVNSLVMEGFDLKLSSNGLLYLTKEVK